MNPTLGLKWYLRSLRNDFIRLEKNRGGHIGDDAANGQVVRQRFTAVFGHHARRCIQLIVQSEHGHSDGKFALRQISKINSLQLVSRCTHALVNCSYSLRYIHQTVVCHHHVHYRTLRKKCPPPVPPPKGRQITLYRTHQPRLVLRCNPCSWAKSRSAIGKQ